MNKLIFQIENNLEDYFIIYPDLRRNILTINRWTRYLLGLFLLFAATAIFFSAKQLAKKEFGYTATAASVVLVVLVANIVESINKKKREARAVNREVSKGSAQVTIDLVGIEMKYAREIKLIEWDKTGQIRLENDFIATQDNMGNAQVLIPKGRIKDEKWIEIREITATFAKSAAAKRNRLYEEQHT